MTLIYIFIYFSGHFTCHIIRPSQDPISRQSVFWKFDDLYPRRITPSTDADLQQTQMYFFERIPS